MNWKRRICRSFLFALLGGVTANTIYFGLLFTRTLHGFAVKALGPAIDIVNRYLDPKYAAGPYCRLLEDFGVNIVLYTFWIFVALLAISVVGQMKRRPAR